MTSRVVWTRFEPPVHSVGSEESVIDTPPRPNTRVEELSSNDSENLPLEQLRIRNADRRQAAEEAAAAALGFDLIGAPLGEPVVGMRPTPPTGPSDVNESSAADQADEDIDMSRVHIQYDFPAAATFVQDCLRLSDTGAYSVEERLLLFLTFFVTTGFTCSIVDFNFSKLALDMSTLWNTMEADGFRAAVSRLRRPDLHPSSTPVSATVADSLQMTERVQEKSGGVPPTEARSAEMDVFAELGDINEAANDYRDATELRPSVQQASVLSDDDEGSVVVDRPSELLQQAVDDGKEQIAMRTAIAELDDSDVDSDATALYHNSEEEDDNNTTGNPPLVSGDASDNDSETTITSHASSVRPQSSTHSLPVPPPASSPLPPPQSASSVENRRRGYVMLAVGDGSKWAARAAARADYWTRRLTSMKASGAIGDDAWDGTPITAKQWNEKTGSPVLRDLFTRDRLVEYQAHRRELLREAKDGQRTMSPNDPPPIPFDPKGRRARKRNSAISLPVYLNTNPRFKRGAVNMDDRMDFGVSMPGMTLREMLDKTSIEKWTKKGRGMLEKNFHLLIVNPKSVPLVGDDSGDAHFMSTTTAKICLRTYLFFANPAYGDPLFPGISETVFQVGFEDIFNLFRAQPQLIPVKFIDLFAGSSSTYDFETNKRWTKRGTPRKFSSSVDPWTRKIITYADDFKQMVFILNGFVQFQVADEAHAGLSVGKPESSILTLFNPDDMGGTVAMLVNLGIPVDSLLEIITMIKLTLDENIDYFMRHAIHRLTAKRDV